MTELSVWPPALALSYTLVCHRKVWLAHHNIPNIYTEELQLGKVKHEARQLNHREIRFGRSISDSIQFRSGILHEYKESKTGLDATTLQTKLYAYLAHTAGIHAKIIHIHLRKTKELIIIPIDIPALHAELVQARAQYQSITSLPTPPTAKPLPICTLCAYRPFCKTQHEHSLHHFRRRT